MVRDIQLKKGLIRKQVQTQGEAAFLPTEAPVLPRYPFCTQDRERESSEPEEEKLPPRKPDISLPGSDRKGSRNPPITASASQEAAHALGRQTPKHGTAQEQQKPELLRIAQVFDLHEQRMTILQKDKEIYDAQNKHLGQKVGALRSQVDEAQQDASKCIIP